MKKLLIFMVICSITLGLFSGCSLFKKSASEEEFDDELYPVSSIVLNEEEAKKLNDKVQVHLYFANADGSKLQKEIRYIPMTDAKKSVNSLAGVIVKELIKGPSTNDGLQATIPKETQLRSPVVIEGRVATVDLTKEFVEKHPGGKKAEELTIYSIVNSLTELKEIESVKFTIDGQDRKEYKGNFKFDSAYPRNTELIDKDSKVTSSIVSEEEDMAVSEEGEDIAVSEDGENLVEDESQETLEILE